MLNNNEIEIIRRNVETCKGEKVRLTSNKGRKKIVVHEGIVENVYDNVFVVNCEDKSLNTRKITFSYTDILTKTVEFILFKNDKKLKLTF